MANTTLTLLAAGSLRSAFLPLVAHFRQHTGLAVDAQFGPAGLLRERIEAGSPCAVFASANAAHPQALLQAGLAQECQGFASNQLMLTARRSPDNDGLDWLALLSTPRLRLATSTPGWPCIALSSATLVRGISGRRVLCRSATQRKPRRQQRERGGGMADQAYRQAVRLPEMRFAQHVGGLTRQPPALRQQKQRMAGHL